jgi:hypothetical protein
LPLPYRKGGLRVIEVLPQHPPLVAGELLRRAGVDLIAHPFRLLGNLAGHPLPRPFEQQGLDEVADPALHRRLVPGPDLDEDAKAHAGSRGTSTVTTTKPFSSFVVRYTGHYNLNNGKAQGIKLPGLAVLSRQG